MKRFLPYVLLAFLGIASGYVTHKFTYSYFVKHKIINCTPCKEKAK